MAINYYSSGNDQCWETWTTATASTCSPTSSDNSWYYWTTGTAATTSSATLTWHSWNGQYYQEMANPIYYERKQVQVKLTEEQVAEMNRLNEERRVASEARLAEERKKAEAARLKKEEAKKKAYQLLVSLLNEEQIKDLEKTKSFGFVSPSGKVYRISEGWSHNITMQDGKSKRTLCCHPKKAIPVYDNMTAQLLLLKYQEEEFVKMANKGYEQNENRNQVM